MAIYTGDGINFSSLIGTSGGTAASNQGYIDSGDYYNRYASAAYARNNQLARYEPKPYKPVAEKRSTLVNLRIEINGWHGSLKG